MKLIEYKTTRKFSRENPSISFSKSGTIHFSHTAVMLMKLKAGDKVAFYQDEDNQMDWYLKKNHEGATLRHNTSGQGLCCNFSDVSSRILEALNKEKAVIRIATIPENGMYAILTKSI